MINDTAGLMVLGICRRGQVRRQCNQQCISSNCKVIFELTPWSSHRFQLSQTPTALMIRLMKCSDLNSLVVLFSVSFPFAHFCYNILFICVLTVNVTSRFPVQEFTCHIIVVMGVRYVTCMCLLAFCAGG